MGLAPFETVVATYHAQIYRYLRRVAPRPSDADDLSQETFIRAFRAYRRLPPDANVRAWLYAIATNVCRNHHRSERRRTRAYVAARDHRGATDGEDPEGAMVVNETRVAIEDVVARLPLKQRLAFTMRKLHDLDYDAIGESLDCSPEAARAHVFQALRKVRRALDGHGLAAPEGAR